MDNSYTTRQGESIFELFKSNPGAHFTADDIIKELSLRGKPIGKATVYRHLEKLIKAGFIRKYIVEEGVSACYEYTGQNNDCASHYHLKCSECGKLLHIKCSFLDEVSEHIVEHHGFVIHPEKTVLYGVCRKCRERKNEV